MCGIVGIVNAQGAADLSKLAQMRQALVHRGPDDSGQWQEGGVALGHQRLAVVDISPQGHQPMISGDARYALAYNGEVYNFQALRSALTSRQWRGRSDTEVLLESIARWGLQATLERCVGMFALAVWDRQTHTLQLARDRLGIKPLYYGWVGQEFVFASELSAIRTAYAAKLQVNRDALSGFLRHYYVPANQSIFTGLNKLPPGTVLTLDGVDIAAQQLPEPIAYWSLQPFQSNHTTMDDVEAAGEFHRLAKQAVADRLIADVPLGAFLSGGLDSSLVCALMAEQSATPINTFTMGFDDPAFDESPHAAAVAAHLGCRHTSERVSEQDLLTTVGQLPKLLDEPFADSSIIPTALVSGLARSQVTVALSGDGGDELFWGYARYPIWQQLNDRLLTLPKPLRTLLATLLNTRGLQWLADALPLQGLLGSKHPVGGRMQSLAALLGTANDAQLYHALVSLWKQPNDVVIGGREPSTVYTQADHWTAQLTPWRRVSAQDLHAYLPDDILTKVDRASMSVSLEARVPLLDHRLVEFCFGLPEHLIRTRNGSHWSTKTLLRQTLLQYVPAALVDRPKQGFGVPVDSWLRGPLKHWMTDMLSADRLKADGYLQPAPIAKLVNQHLDGRADWGAYLWCALMFQTWLHGQTP